MKIFIICCLLFIHVNMCIYIRGFRVSIRVSGIRGFGFGDGFPPESVFGADSGFDFGFQFWVHGDSTRSEPDPLPSLDERLKKTYTLSPGPTRIGIIYGMRHNVRPFKERQAGPTDGSCISVWQ